MLSIADNVFLFRHSIQVLPRVDTFATIMDTILLRLNPAESLIFLPNSSPQHNFATLQTPMDPRLSCAKEEIKILCAPIGHQHFEEVQFKTFSTKVEDDLSLQQQMSYQQATAADKFVDLLHLQQGTLLSGNSIPLNFNCNRAPT